MVGEDSRRHPAGRNCSDPAAMFTVMLVVVYALIRPRKHRG